MSDVFEAVFENVETGEKKTLEFTLQQYIQARLWITTPHRESGTELQRWLLVSNTNRQAAYCAVKVWREELHRKGAQ